MIRWTAPVALLASLCVTVPAQAGHRAPITGAYQVIVPVTSACRAGVPGGDHRHPVTLPERGQMEIALAGQGFDMDLELTTEAGGPVALSRKPGAAEKINYKVRRPGKYAIRVCNYIAGPIGDVTYVFTFQ